MIHDALANAGRYAPMHPLFATAFAWLADERNRDSADGRYPLLDQRLFAIVESGVTMPCRDKRFESHRRYIDIQINLGGGEIMEWAPSAELAVVDDFKPDGDIRFHAQPGHGPTRLHVRPGEFAIFWPEDAHKPCCRLDDRWETGYRKIVFKVERDAHLP